MMFGLHCSIIVFWYSLGLTTYAFLASLFGDNSLLKSEDYRAVLLSVLCGSLAAVGELC